MFLIGWLTPPCLLAQDEQTENPALEQLNDAIVFYASFDREDLLADMAEGRPKPLSIDGEVKLKPGKYGKALLVGTQGGGGIVRYSRKSHIDMTKPGAIAFWIAVQDWREESSVSERGYVVFFRARASAKSSLLVERMGFTPKSRESILTGHFGFADRSDEFVKLFGSRAWNSGEWHLIVVNWDDSHLEMSLDGGALKRKPFAKPLEASDQSDDPRIAWMSIGGSEEETSLIDELMIFRRKLTQDEISKLWQ